MPGIFITGTDTGVGKTLATYVLALLSQEQGWDVGIMKPVQCGGQDAAFFKKRLNLDDDLKRINPFYARRAVSPHVAFAHEKKIISLTKILEGYRYLSQRHEYMLVEGAGGIMVPLTDSLLMLDVIQQLDLEVVMVARLGLGTINHTLLTIQQLRQAGLKVRGVILNQTAERRKGLSEQSNPAAIEKYGQVPILGILPFLKKTDCASVIWACAGYFDMKSLWASATHSSVLTMREQRHLQQWDKKYVWHPFTQMQEWLNKENVIIHEAQGCTLVDTQGRRYLDGVSSLWVNVHGHGHAHINQAVKNQVDHLQHSTLLGLSNSPSVKLAKKLVEITPKGLDKVFYSDSGSTSVEIALKMAYQYWQNIGRKKKTVLAHLENAYHGDTLGSVSVGGIDLFHQVYRKLILKTISVPFSDGYRVPQGKVPEEYMDDCLQAFEKFVVRNYKTLAAFIVEPLVQGAAGMFVWPSGVLRRFRDICTQYEVLLIADEVATGFGRTGKMFACEHEQVVPDILCLAKGLTGGYLPLAATMTTQKIFDGFCFDYKDQKTFFHGHTYTGNPLACAAALANLEVFKKEQTLKKLGVKINYLKKRLAAFYQLPHVGQVRQCGFMVGIELVQDTVTKKAYPWDQQMGVRVCEAARQENVLLRPLGNVIVLMPPLAITLKELTYLCDVTYRSIQKITEGER